MHDKEHRDDSEDWLTIVDAAFRLQQLRLHVGPRQLRVYIDSERIPHQERDGIRRIRVNDVIRFIELRTTEPPRPESEPGGTGEELFLKFTEL